MPFQTCQHSRGAIDRAGQQLVDLQHGNPLRDQAIEVISNWRQCHRYPLSVVKMTLKKRAKTKVDKNVLVSQRIKRLPSIRTKLKQSSTRLSQMQDIGGCRAVLDTVAEVDALVKIYYDQQSRHPQKDRPYIIRESDYITKPRDDGYRSFHLVMEYFGKTTEKRAYDGQKIEIQIRTKRQHAWATALEACEAFTGQALKTKIKTARESWVRFFALMGTAIATREKRPPVPDTPTDRNALRAEVKALESDLNVITLLKGWRRAMKYQQEEAVPGAVAFLLELNTQARILHITSFKKKHLPFADVAYLKREKETENDPTIQVVLVNADSVGSIPRAYPNYYVDTEAFIAAVEDVMR